MKKIMIIAAVVCAAFTFGSCNKSPKDKAKDFANKEKQLRIDQLEFQKEVYEYALELDNKEFEDLYDGLKDIDDFVDKKLEDKYDDLKDEVEKLDRKYSKRAEKLRKRTLY